MRNALITGGSMGLGRALAAELAGQGWHLTLTARRAVHLTEVADGLTRAGGSVSRLAGDVTEPGHRARLIELAAEAGPIDLVVNNASELGGSPLPGLDRLEADSYRHVLETNVVAPQQLIQAVLPRLSPTAVIVNISSDAGVEHYPTWGGYGSSKAALDHQTLSWAAEHPEFRWYAVDPGDLRTAMHQAAFPGEDISDRPEPESVAPVLARLVGSELPSGRYRLSDLAGRSGVAA